MNRKHFPYYIVAVVMACLLYACANPGNPSGGPVDKSAPIFVNSSPRPNELNVDAHRINLYFDEVVNVKDPTTKVIVSPAQVERPKISTSGRRVTVELFDTLKENTTYTIDFSNAIRDNNEDNPIENFAFAFSTGDRLDTLRVSGYVFDAYTLEPQQNVIVGLHSDLSDTAFTKLRLERVARTNDRGQFTVRNIAPGKYHIFALSDLDGDYKFSSPLENLAFLDSIVVPEVSMKEVTDTIYNEKNEVDTLINRQRAQYYPNDILLSMFAEDFKQQYLADNKRQDSTRIYLRFAAPSDTLPTLTLLNKPDAPADWYTLERTKTNDTLTYWIRPPHLISSDTLLVALNYLRTDSLNQLSPQNDTLRFTFQRPKPKKRKKDDEEADSVPAINFLSLGAVTSSTQEVYAPVLFASTTPLDKFDKSAIHLQQMADTLWVDVPDCTVAWRDSTMDRRTISVRHSWTPGGSYRLMVDSLAMTDIYGVFNKPWTSEFKVRAIEEYGNLIFNIAGIDGKAFVELLNASDEVVLRAPVRNGKAELINLLPSKYYARLVMDANGNGKFDAGNYAEGLQPEECFYYPGMINLKKNWDIEQTWDIFATPVDKQKPEAIKKNKPEKKKWEETPKPTENEGEEELDEFGNPYDPNNPYYGNQNNRNNFGF